MEDAPHMTGETLLVTRGHTDRKGNRVDTGTHSLTGVLSWGTWGRTTGQRADTSHGTAELYVDTGADVRQRDRITRASGEQFTVVSPALWDGVHPTTGHDFRVAVYQLEAITG